MQVFLMAACHHFQQEKGAVLLGNARVAAQLALQDPCSHFPAAGGVGCWLLMDESLFRNYLLPKATPFPLVSCLQRSTYAGHRLQHLYLDWVNNSAEPPRSGAPVKPAEAPAAATSLLTFSRCSSCLPKLVCKAFSELPRVQSLAAVSVSSASASANGASAE